MSQVVEMLRWLLGENAPVDAVLDPTDALTLAIAVFVLAGGILFAITWRDKVKRDARTRKLIEDERTIYRMRRM